jgi:hypothetical protein
MSGLFDKDSLQNIIDYVLILGVLVLVSYYIYKTIEENKKSSPTIKVIPYDDTPNSSQIQQLSKIEGITTSAQITNTTFDPSNDNALRLYCIKSSSNSAYTGGYMNLNMIKYVLSKGCRFLDFEIYMKDNVPIVAYSTNKQSLETFTSNAPAISFSGVCSTIITNAFSDTSPNPKDPLFIHLRIKTYDSSAYTQIAKIIKTTLGPKLYTQKKGVNDEAIPVNLDSQLTSMLEKIIIIVDETSSPGYKNYATCVPKDVECYSLSNVVNMTSNSQATRIYNENSLTFQPINPPDPDVYLFRIVFPNLGYFNNTTNSSSSYLIKNYGVQVVAQAFYVNDTNLINYEGIFKDKKSAFVRMAGLLNNYE